VKPLPFVQTAYLVGDVFAAAREWAGRRGAGPFFVLEHIALDDVVYRGRPGKLDHSSAYGQLGEMMIELVQVHGEGPSAFRDLFEPGEYGLHHLATFAPDLEAELAGYEARGYPVAARARASEVAFAFVDTSRELRHMIEVYQDGPGIRGFYRMVAEAARDWDGRDPVRPLG
jgi:hypothetical protein